MLMRLFYRFMDWRKQRARAQRQTCWCYCPYCNTELTAALGRVAFDDGRIVTYECMKCGATAWFDFAPPVPLLVKCQPGGSDAATSR
jgi:hypothetical protein